MAVVWSSKRWSQWSTTQGLQEELLKEKPDAKKVGAFIAGGASLDFEIGGCGNAVAYVAYKFLPPVAGKNYADNPAIAEEYKSGIELLEALALDTNIASCTAPQKMPAASSHHDATHHYLPPIVLITGKLACCHSLIDERNRTGAANLFQKLLAQCSPHFLQEEPAPLLSAALGGCPEQYIKQPECANGQAYGSTEFARLLLEVSANPNSRFADSNAPQTEQSISLPTAIVLRAFEATQRDNEQQKLIALIEGVRWFEPFHDFDRQFDYELVFTKMLSMSHQHKESCLTIIEKIVASRGFLNFWQKLSAQKRQELCSLLVLPDNEPVFNALIHSTTRFSEPPTVTHYGYALCLYRYIIEESLSNPLSFTDDTGKQLSKLSSLIQLSVDLIADPSYSKNLLYFCARMINSSGSENFDEAIKLPAVAYFIRHNFVTEKQLVQLTNKRGLKHFVYHDVTYRNFIRLLLEKPETFTFEVQEQLLLFHKYSEETFSPHWRCFCIMVIYLNGWNHEQAVNDPRIKFCLDNGLVKADDLPKDVEGLLKALDAPDSAMIVFWHLIQNEFSLKPLAHTMFLVPTSKPEYINALVARAALHPKSHIARMLKVAAIPKLLHFADGGKTNLPLPEITAHLLKYHIAPPIHKTLPAKIEAQVAQEKCLGGCELVSLDEIEQILGRTIVVKNGSQRLAIKVEKNSLSDAEQLKRESAIVKVLAEEKKRLGLQSAIPHSRGIRTIRRDTLIELLQKKKTETQSSEDQLQTFMKMIPQDKEQLTVYVYEAPPEYFHYLHEPASDFKEMCAASRVAMHDAYTLLKEDVCFYQLADVFHNTEHQNERSDGGRYLVLSGLLRTLLSGFYLQNTGRLTGWMKAISYENLRKSGLADLGDWLPADEAFRPTSDFAEQFFQEAILMYGERTGTYMAANELVTPLFVIFLTAGAWAIQMKQKHHLETEQIPWQDIAKAIIMSAAQVVAITTGFREDLAYRFFVQMIQPEMLARQMQFWMTNEYIPYSDGRRLPEGLYDQGTQTVFLRGQMRSDTFNDTIGFSINGTDQDLGPVNGPFPITTFISLAYLVATLVSGLQSSAQSYARLEKEAVAHYVRGEAEQAISLLEEAHSLAPQCSTYYRWMPLFQKAAAKTAKPATAAASSATTEATTSVEAVATTEGGSSSQTTPMTPEETAKENQAAFTIQRFWHKHQYAKQQQELAEIEFPQGSVSSSQ